MSGIVIVGAGQAAASLAAKSRSLGYTAPITIIGDETVPPYQRPPLSKDYLLGQTSVERLLLRAPAFWNEQDVTMRLGEPVTSINRTEKTVRVVGETLEYDQLVLATGSTPRLLPAELGGDLTGVYAIRGLNDVDAMVPEFCAGRRLLIIGGGYIGLEAAAVGAELGLAVTLIEMAPRILQRVASPETSSHFRELHRAHGFRILENTGIDRLIGDSRVSGAVLSDGTRLDVDFVIVGIGILPRTMLAEEAGLTVANGIATDGQGRTSDPNIWAAGECASFPAAHGEMRLESVGHAIDHGELVAANILGAGASYRPKPWFWSDQYSVKLQIAGLNTGYDRTVERWVDTSSGSIWYYREGRLLALDAMNDPRAYFVAKRIIEGGRTVAPELVMDQTREVKSLLSEATL